MTAPSSLPPGWYILCRARQLKDKPLRRMFCGRALVVLREADGQIRAQEERHGRCWPACERQAFIWIRHDLPALSEDPATTPAAND